MRHRAIVQAFGALGVFAVIGVCTLYVTKSTAQSAKDGQSQADSNASPIYGVTIPVGYRDWRLISVKRLTGKQLTGAGGNLKQLRAELGNDLGIKAYRDGTLPFPDGSIIAALHWNEESVRCRQPSLSRRFSRRGPPIILCRVRRERSIHGQGLKKYAASGGWGFADFTNGKPGNEALHAKCFPCHAPAKDRDYVFTRYAPTPGTK